jgi:hypothetical protein
MSLLDYSEIVSNNLILSQKPVIEGAVNMNEIGNGNNARDVAAADVLAKDLDKVMADLQKYNANYASMMDTRGRIYSFNPSFDEQNPVNDPISHEYIPRINETALADIQSRLDFQNRVYAYTAVGLISVIIAGVMFNSSR